MERLTEKGDKLGSYYIYKSNSDVAFTSVQFDFHTNKVYNKLGKLEDLEEEIGCPLEVRCKVYYNSTIYNCLGYKMTVKETYEDHFLAALENDIFSFEYKNYMQDWFLGEDKSE